MIERREEPRACSDLSATIRVLACDNRFSGRILDMTDKGMALFSPVAIEPGAAIALMYKGVLVLAEVVYCCSSTDGYRAGVKVDQALATSDLTVADFQAEIQQLLNRSRTESPSFAFVAAQPSYGYNPGAAA